MSLTVTIFSQNEVVICRQSSKNKLNIANYFTNLGVFNKIFNNNTNYSSKNPANQGRTKYTSLFEVPLLFFGVYWTDISKYFMMSQHRGCKSEKRHSMVIEVMRLTII